MKKASPSREELLVQYLRRKALGKKHYAKADELLVDLLEQTAALPEPSPIVHPTTGEVFEIVDTFATSNVAFGHGSVRRFDLKEVRKDRRAVRPA